LNLGFCPGCALLGKLFDPPLSLALLCKAKMREVGHQWLTPVILAAPEAEIRRIRIGGQPG
jgi:hypothetical protein